MNLEKGDDVLELVFGKRVGVDGAASYITHGGDSGRGVGTSC